jgi:glycosyltransferase involved in cell wall biosynthesis
LLVVGADDANDYREYAARLSILEKCSWEQPRGEVLDFYAAADAYISPSLEDSFGLPVAEAMACGLPVVTSVDAGVAELIHDGIDGFVLRDPSDAQRLAELIERLHGDRELRVRVGESAARTVAEWTWDRHAAAVWDLVKEAGARR